VPDARGNIVELMSELGGEQEASTAPVEPRSRIPTMPSCAL
jgi:hypothetical protein